MGTSKSEKKRRRKANSSDRSRSPSGSRRRRRNSYSRSRSRSPEHLRFQIKALKYVTQGNAGRLRKLLRSAVDAAAGLAAVDSQSRTLLHQACACGHAAGVALLLRYGASAAAVDAFGDTPAHLAARAGHLEALAEAMQAPGAPTLDTAGAGGVTLSQLLDRALRGRDSGAAAAPCQATGAARSAAEDDDDARWRQRLREECSGGEEAAEEDGWQGARGPESYYGDDDDEWADRLWRQMQRRRAAAAATSAAAFTADLRAGNARRAAEAAERSARILRDEQAKDTDWRRRTLAIEAGPAAAAPDLTASRVAYDERWAQLDRETAAAAAVAPLRYHDVPWPLEPLTPGAASGPQRVAAPPPVAPPPAPCADSLRDFVLLGAGGPSDVKRRLRCELLRWHPDKFGARFGARLAAAGAAHRAVALARVQQLAQVLTQVLGRGGGGA